MRAALGYLVLLGSVALLFGACSQDPHSWEAAAPAKITDVQGLHRVNVAIAIPPDRSEEDLSATLEKAARELAVMYEADVVLVRAFGSKEEAEPNGWAVGKAILGPGGHLIGVAGVPDQPTEVSIELGPSVSTGRSFK